MSNPFDEIRDAVSAARLQLKAADDATDSMVRLIAGRLRHVETYQGVAALKAIKLELRNFNAVTGRWSEDR